MKTSSAKAKGRSACLAVQELLLSYAPDLTRDDIFVKTGSAPGEDIHFSPRARVIYDFSVEVKNVESLNVWNAYAQAKTHTAKRPESTPIVFYKRNRSELMVTLSAEHFLKLVR